MLPNKRKTGRPSKNVFSGQTEVGRQSAYSLVGIMRSIVIIMATAFLAPAQPALASDTDSRDCPITHGAQSLGPPYPKSENWYGSGAFAVKLPAHGKWATTKDDALVAARVSWFSPGFRPGMEENLNVKTRRIGKSENDSVVSGPTNAHSPSLGAWIMLTDIDFPSPGCFEISAEYLSQSIVFVVLVVDIDGNYRELNDAD